MSQSKIKVVIADDDVLMRTNLAKALRSKGINIVEQIGAVGAIHEAVVRHHPCVLLLDLKWYGSSQEAMIAIRNIKSTIADVKIIAMTAWPALRKAATEAGAIDAIEKGFSVEQIVNLVREHNNEQIISPPQPSPSLNMVDLFSLLLLFFATAAGLFVLMQNVASIQQFTLIVASTFIVWMVLTIFLGRSREWISESVTYQLLSSCITFIRDLFK